jgi:hypothetical protein
MHNFENSKELEQLVVEVLKIQEKYGYELTNVETRRINEIREIIDKIVTTEAE